MLIIVGFLVGTVSIIVGYTAHHGNLAVLFQWTEIVIIVGAGVGALLISTPMTVIKDIAKQVTHAMKAKEPAKEEYMEVLLLLYELCKTAKANPLSLEPHVENPENSDIFKRYPGVLHNHHAVHFICDTLKVQLSTGMSPYDLEELMDLDIRTVHDQELKAPVAVNTLSDAFPGLGIVAAVLGVVITMGKLTQGKEVIGQSVAAALVGTFMGILLCYGYVGPLAQKMTANIGIEGIYLNLIKSCLLAYAKNCSPKVCVEFSRRALPPHVRPTFEEVDKATSSAGKAA
ncbi:MAG: flagellar motor stator protein MotA [Bdellovibrionota bacterium]